MRRVRSPRYAAALLVGGLYIWAFLFRPMRTPGIAWLFLGQGTEMIVTLLAVLTLMGSWVFGADATALAFTQAEVSILFSAPLSRRRLIGYKLFRAQIAVLINSLIWVFVLRRGGTILPSPLRAISLWVLFSTLNLHRLGAALVRSSWREHGGIGAKRNRWSIFVFALIADCNHSRAHRRTSRADRRARRRVVLHGARANARVGARDLGAVPVPSRRRSNLRAIGCRVGTTARARGGDARRARLVGSADGRGVRGSGARGLDRTRTATRRNARAPIARRCRAATRRDVDASARVGRASRVCHRLEEHAVPATHDSVACLHRPAGDVDRARHGLLHRSRHADAHRAHRAQLRRADARPGWPSHSKRSCARTCSTCRSSNHCR